MQTSAAIGWMASADQGLPSAMGCREAVRASTQGTPGWPYPLSAERDILTAMIPYIHIAAAFVAVAVAGCGFGDGTARRPSVEPASPEPTRSALGATATPGHDPSLSTTPVGPTPAPTQTTAPGATPTSDVPIIDLHFHPGWEWDVEGLLNTMDELGVAGAGNGVLRYDGQPGSDEVALEFADLHPDRFFPFAGQVAIRDLILLEGEGAWELRSEKARAYVEDLEAELEAGRWAGIGELFVYNIHTHPAEDFAATSFPPDSPLMRALWRLSATHGVPLSVHMEARGEYVLEMGRLLASDRAGTWVWAHTGYYADPELLRTLFEKHPNLYAELSWRDSVRTSRLGVPIDRDRVLKQEWKDLLVDFADRFVVGTDVATGSLDEYRAVIGYWREILGQLPPDAAAKIAHGNARQLLLRGAFPRTE